MAYSRIPAAAMLRCAALLGSLALLAPGPAGAELALGVLGGLGACGAASTPVHDIQGRERTSPLVGESGVIVEAVVVGLFPGLPDGLGGFFVQQRDDDIDGDELTSEGLFVFAPDLAAVLELRLGDVVRLRGEVQEFFGMTELSRIDGLLRCSTEGAATPAEPWLPVPAVDPSEPSYWERWEGMQVRFRQPLFVVDQYAAGRFGELELAATPRLWQPTQRASPGPEAIARFERDERQRILLDDGQTRVRPEPWPYLEAIDGGTLRLADRLSALEGVLHFSFGRFRVQPTRAPKIRATAAPPAPPKVPGALRIVAWNVENLFNGDGMGGGFPTRGAASASEYTRQLAKVIATLAALDADILALVELENDASDERSVLLDLARALRSREPALDYLPIDTRGELGDHAIAVGLLYRERAVRALGPASILDERAHASFDSRRNRPSLAQTFLHLASSETFTVVVSHLKSKGSSCAGAGDPDLADGQGHCNHTRRLAARAVAEWIASDPTSAGGAPALLLGDLNAHPREDPLGELGDAGFVDLLATLDSPDAYSFVFDGRVGRLDHALAGPRLLSRVGGAAIWNINADESPALDYREDNPAGFYRADPRRASDHDPVLVGLFPQPVPAPGASVLLMAALAVLCRLRRMDPRVRSSR